MLRLFWNTLTPVALGVDKRALAKAIADVKADIEQSKRALEEIAKMMARMAEMGHQDSPEYRRVLTAYQNLSRLVTEASKELKAREEQEIKEMRATQPLPAGFDFAGISPFKATLGPAGRHGVVSEGEDVVNLQKFLTAVGFAVPASGDFDAKTRMAVQQFQTKYGIHADGMVGAATRKVMNDLLKGK